LVPIADWSRLRVVLDGEPLLAREATMLAGVRRLDLRRSVLLSSWTHCTPSGITITGHELRLLSRADCATGLQLLQLSLDRDGDGRRAVPGPKAPTCMGKPVVRRALAWTRRAAWHCWRRAAGDADGRSPMELRVGGSTHKLAPAAPLKMAL
jgi:hypothetical protein